MLGMATEKKKRKAQGRARERGATRMVTVELEVALDDALEVFRNRKDIQRTKKAVVRMALLEHLAKHNALPAGEI